MAADFKVFGDGFDWYGQVFCEDGSWHYALGVSVDSEHSNFTICDGFVSPAAAERAMRVRLAVMLKERQAVWAAAPVR